MREQENPNMVIPTRYQRIDSNYYVVLSKVRKNWGVLSLSLGYESEDSYSANSSLEDIDIEDLDKPSKSKDSLVSIIRIYSDINNIQKASFLTEKKKNKYISEIMDLEIGFINQTIEKLNKQIDEDNENIKGAESKISELRNDKKYQTDSEKITTETNIEKLKNLISSTKSIGDERVAKVKELKEKISKLEKKKSDFGL